MNRGAASPQVRRGVRFSFCAPYSLPSRCLPFTIGEPIGGPAPRRFSAAASRRFIAVTMSRSRPGAVEARRGRVDLVVVRVELAAPETPTP